MDLGRVIFAELAVRIGASRVEVAQRDRAYSIRAFEMRQRMLDGQLRLTVGVHRSRWMRLANRRFHRLAVDGAGRGEDELPALLGGHRFERRQRTADVVS